jgi:hypothetical protein
LRISAESVAGGFAGVWASTHGVMAMMNSREMLFIVNVVFMLFIFHNKCRAKRLVPEYKSGNTLAAHPHGIK